MDDRLGSLEQKVDELSHALAAVQERLLAIESNPASAAVGAARRAAVPGWAPDAAGEPGSDDSEVVTVLGLVGRTCLVLGGAYLLRALTDGGTLPRMAGTLVGLAYAVAWLLMAHRQPAGRPTLVPAFYGAAAALIAFPLLWEATVSFRLLSPAAAALAMTVITGLALWIAWRRRLQSLAWIITIAALLAAPLFMLALGPAVPFGFYLAFLGIVTLWMGYSLDWIWLRWPVAFAVDLTVVMMAGSVTGAWGREGASAVMLLQLSLFGAYLASIAARTIWRCRDVIPFEVVQTLVLFAVGFGGAAYVMRSTGSGAPVLGVASLVFGIGSYGVAFAFVDWRRGHWKNFVFYTSLAVVFVLAGTGLTVGARSQAVAWSACAVASAWLGWRYSTIALWPHSATYIVSAAIVSGLVAFVSDAFLASSASTWAPFAWPALGVLAAAAACCAVSVPAVGESWRRAARMPKLAVAIVLLLGVGATVVGLLVPLLSARPGAGADAGVVAGVRTFVLAAAAMVLAWLGGSGTFPEGRWLTHVVLVIGGLKLLMHDFMAGRPATLFVSLAVYGAALIVAPKWARRHGGKKAVMAATPART